MPCWAWVLPGAALLTFATFYLLWALAIPLSESRSFSLSCNRAGLLSIAEVLCLVVFFVVPVFGYAGLLLSTWLESGHFAFWGVEQQHKGAAFLAFVFIQLIFASAFGGAAFLLSRAAQQPGCSGGAAAWPALVGIVAPSAAFALLTLCCGGFALLGSFLRRRAQKASKSVADEGAPSEAGSEASLEEPAPV